MLTIENVYEGKDKDKDKDKDKEREKRTEQNSMVEDNMA
jgi:hypothetical protein